MRCRRVRRSAPSVRRSVRAASATASAPSVATTSPPPVASSAPTSATNRRQVLSPKAVIEANPHPCVIDSFNDEHDPSASMAPLTVLVGLLRRVERKLPPGKRFEVTLLDQPAQRLEWDTG